MLALKSCPPSCPDVDMFRSSGSGWEIQSQSYRLCWNVVRGGPLSYRHHHRRSPGAAIQIGRGAIIDGVNDRVDLPD